MSACDCYGCAGCAYRMLDDRTSIMGHQVPNLAGCRTPADDFCTYCAIRLCEGCVTYNNNEEPICRGGCQQ